MWGRKKPFTNNSTQYWYTLAEIDQTKPNLVGYGDFKKIKCPFEFLFSREELKTSRRLVNSVRQQPQPHGNVTPVFLVVNPNVLILLCLESISHGKLSDNCVHFTLFDIFGYHLFGMFLRNIGCLICWMNENRNMQKYAVISDTLYSCQTTRHHYWNWFEVWILGET